MVPRFVSDYERPNWFTPSGPLHGIRIMPLASKRKYHEISKFAAYAVKPEGKQTYWEGWPAKHSASPQGSAANSGECPDSTRSETFCTVAHLLSFGSCRSYTHIVSGAATTPRKMTNMRLPPSTIRGYIFRILLFGGVEEELKVLDLKC